jgi:hypothetical protein
MSEPIRWAADLVRELKRTGTGEAKLDVVRAAMRERFDAGRLADLPPDHPGRHLTAEEAVAVLDGHELTAGSVTCEKARALARVGVYVEPPAAAPARPVEDLLPPPPGGTADRTAEPGAATEPAVDAGAAVADHAGANIFAPADPPERLGPQPADDDGPKAGAKPGVGPVHHPKKK